MRLIRLLVPLLLVPLLLAGCGSGDSPASPTPVPPPPTAAPQPTLPPGAMPGIAKARQDIAQRTGVPQSTIQLVSVTPHDWPTPALGCPQSGHAYAQVITPGYILVLATADARYTYHANAAGDVVTCPETP